MRIWRVLVPVMVVLALGGVVYGWGNGLFYPCGPLDRILSMSQCRVLVGFDATQPQALLLLPNGNLLTVLRGDGEKPAKPMQLTEVALADGSVASQVPADVPADGSWMNVALSPSGKLIAASLLDEPATVIDRASGKTLAKAELYSAANIGFDGEDRLLLDPGQISPEHPPEPVAQVFSASDGSAQGRLTGGAATQIFSQGVSQAISPDGKYLAQHVETESDSGVVAIRLADMAFPAWSGMLLTAPLDTWQRHLLPSLWFSPDGKYLAAAFDDPNLWGKDTNALLIWDVEQHRLVQRVPTHDADWDSLVWLPDRHAVAVTHFDLNSRRGEIAVIDY
jgi:hypothetical protein